MVTLAVTLAQTRLQGTAWEQPKVIASTPEVMELARGIEPPTCGLQNHCSAIELRQPVLIFCGLVTLLAFGMLVKCSRRVLLEVLAESRCRLSQVRFADMIVPFPHLGGGMPNDLHCRSGINSGTS